MAETAHALDAPVWQRVETALMSTARSIRVAYDRCLGPLSLNLSQASMIGYIAANGPMNQTELAAALVLGRAATGSMVDQLESRGLVQRVPDPHDRRVWLVENTDEGARLAVEIVRVDEELRAQLRTGITRAERQQLAAMLLRLDENASDEERVAGIRAETAQVQASNNLAANSSSATTQKNSSTNTPNRRTQ